SRGAQRAVKLNKREWDETVQKLAAMFDGVKNGRARLPGAPTAQIKTGILSTLQQDETRYYATTIIERTESHLRIATVSWRKEPLEPWLATAENQVRTALTAPTSYRLPMVSDGAGCTDDTWTATAAPPDARAGHTAVW